MSESKVITAVLLATLSLLPLACDSTGEDDTTAAEESAQTATGGTASPTADPEQPLSAREERGRELFVESCGSCHALDAAGTSGQIGPDLDEAQLDEAMVLRAIEMGGTGSGNMPPNLVSGKDALDVAAFVAASGPGP
ncbi:MAG: c-type cytochrome [Solirubrobacterales bacterium]